jgi:leucyl/phenylalanyl-tRNA--protein transferase
MRTLLDLPCLGPQADAPFPPPGDALSVPNGLLAWGGDLRSERLLNAYRSGIFPWYQEGQPILWWSPAPRCVILPQDVHISRRTRRRHNSGSYRISADLAFEEVIRACAEPRDYDAGTWITHDMMNAYINLHHQGHAHSVEVWAGPELIGGIYGLAIGTAFFGESMFSRWVDASKIALIALCKQLVDWSFGLLDCQVSNPHLMRMGAMEISRQEFTDRLSELVTNPGFPGPWTERFQSVESW